MNVIQLLWSSFKIKAPCGALRDGDDNRMQSWKAFTCLDDLRKVVFQHKTEGLEMSVQGEILSERLFSSCPCLSSFYGALLLLDNSHILHQKIRLSTKRGPCRKCLGNKSVISSNERYQTCIFDAYRDPQIAGYIYFISQCLYI